MQSQAYAHAYHDAFPSELPQEGWKRLEIHESAEVHGILKALEADMKAFGYPRQDTFAVCLVLLEAAANALRHGNRGNTARTVLISYHLNAAAVLIEVADQGRGFNPYLVPDPLDEDRKGGPSGRGLLLMRRYTSWIRFNKQGNRVLLCRRRSTP